MNANDQPQRLLTPGVAVFLLGFIIGMSFFLRLWGLDETGLSIVSGTTPYWDFNNLWTGGRLALTGQVDYIFNMDLYRPAMDALFGQDMPDQEWSYPPSMLLIGAPLALFPPLIAYMIWSLGSLAMLHFAIRPLKLKPILHGAALLSPFVLVNALFGQNGTFISALLIAGLLQAPKRPVLAGICFGLMTVKPHLGILIPFLLIASGNWRAFASASVTAVLMFAATSMFFGFEVWTNFLHTTQPMMQEVMEKPFMHPYQVNSVTPFVEARALGAGLILAYSVQALFSLLAIICGIWLWRLKTGINHHTRVALTLVLVMIATPYGYTYDMVAIGVAIMIFLAKSKRPAILPVLALIWLFPVYYGQIAWTLDTNIGAFIVLGLFAILFMSWLRDRAREQVPQHGG